uniref:Acyl-CoA synthetase n=1 Tax=Rodentolepis nana TaxID=102285 RepID=A0A0R3TU39_RODNA
MDSSDAVGPFVDQRWKRELLERSWRRGFVDLLKFVKEVAAEGVEEGETVAMFVGAWQGGFYCCCC